MYIINRHKLKQKMDNNELQVVIEVLDQDTYESFHLPSALHVPLNDNFENRVQLVAPDKTKPVAVYCLGGRYNTALRAAQKMEQELGYQQVYYYEAGKMEWKDAGLPIETLARSSSLKSIYHPL